MKIIFVNKPLQDDRTDIDKLELVEFVTKTEDDFKNPGTITTTVIKKVPYWCVKSEMLKHDETFRQWLERKWDAIQYASEHSSSVKDKNIEGFYIYDIMLVGGIIKGENMEPTGQIGMMVRWDYIGKNNLK